VSALGAAFAVDYLASRNPIFSECSVGQGEAPFWATNSRGLFVPTRPTPDGFVRSAFFPCAIEEEAQLFVTLYTALSRAPLKSQASTVNLALGRIPGDRRVCVVPPEAVTEASEGKVLGPEIEARMATQGYVLDVPGVRVLAAPLPMGAALVLAPWAVSCVRSGSTVALLLRAADRTTALVNGVG
jgi:hypothetical protein